MRYICIKKLKVAVAHIFQIKKISIWTLFVKLQKILHKPIKISKKKHQNHI